MITPLCVDYFPDSLQMAPSSIDVNQQLSCCMCEQQLEALNKLHHHQMRSHTTEALSLALLVQRGFELIDDDFVRLECEEAIRNGMFGGSPFLLRHNTCAIEGGDVMDDDGGSSPENLVMDLDEESFEKPETMENILIKMEPKETDLADDADLRNIYNYGERTPERKMSYTSLQMGDVELQEPQENSSGAFETDLEFNCAAGGVEEDKAVIQQELREDDPHSGKQRAKHKDNVESIGIAPLCSVPNSLEENCDEWTETKQDPSVPSANTPISPSVSTCVGSPAANSPEVSKDADQSSSLGRHSKRKKQQTPRRYLNNQYLLPSSLASLQNDKAKSIISRGVGEANKKPENSRVGPFLQRSEGEKVDVNCNGTLVAVKRNSQSFENGKESRPLSESTNGASSSLGPGRNSNRKPQKQCSLPRSKKLSQASVNGKKFSLRKIKGKKRIARKSEKNEHRTICNSAMKEFSHEMENDKSPVVKREAFMPISCDSMENIASSSREDRVWSGREFDTAIKITNAKDLMKIYPPGMTDRRFFCEPCGKGYTKKSHLERHLRVHTGERPFPCTFCGKSFAVRSILKQHVRIHTGEKPYCCTVCAHRFPQKSGLMTHMMLHTGKPFKCDRCTKAFVSNHKLLQHLRCHEGQGSHVCSVCKMNFFAEAALKEHTKHHNQKHPHTCMICNASFLLEGHLKQHLDRHLEKLVTNDD